MSGSDRYDVEADLNALNAVIDRTTPESMTDADVYEIKASKDKRFDLNIRLYKNKEKNEFLYVYILWFSVNPKKVGLGSIIINEIIEVLKACTNLEFLVLHPDDNEVKYFWMKNNFMISDGKIENRININTRRILIYNVY